MLAYEIIINNEKKITAGSEDIETLSAHIVATGDLGNDEPEDIEAKKEINLSVSGLDTSYGDDRQYNLEWIKRLCLKEGDEIVFRIIETNEADKPVKINPVNRSIPEEFERIKEMRQSIKINYDMIDELYHVWKKRMQKK